MLIVMITIAQGKESNTVTPTGALLRMSCTIVREVTNTSAGPARRSTVANPQLMRAKASHWRP